MAYTGLPRPMAMRIATAVVLGMLVVWWVIALAGTAAAHKECVDGMTPATSTNTGTNPNINDILNDPNIQNLIQGRRLMGRQLLSAATEACENQFSFTWWIVWFEFILIGCVIALAFNDGWTQRWQPVLVVFLTIVSPLLMYQAAEVNAQIFPRKDSGSDMLSALRCAMAGFVGLCVFNGVYLICAMEASGTLTLGFKAGGQNHAAPKGALPTHNSVSPPGPASPAVLPAVEMPVAAHKVVADPEHS